MGWIGGDGKSPSSRCPSPLAVLVAAFDVLMGGGRSRLGAAEVSLADMSRSCGLRIIVPCLQLECLVFVRRVLTQPPSFDKLWRRIHEASRGSSFPTNHTAQTPLNFLPFQLTASSASFPLLTHRLLPTKPTPSWSSLFFPGCFSNDKCLIPPILPAGRPGSNHCDCTACLEAIVGLKQPSHQILDEVHFALSNGAFLPPGIRP